VAIGQKFQAITDKIKKTVQNQKFRGEKKHSAPKDKERQ